MAEAAAVLDSPEKTNEGSEDTSLLDKKPDATTDGKTAEKQPETSPDKTAKDSLLDKPTDDKKPAAVTAPEKYADFKAPEGMSLDAKLIEKFDAEAKALNIPQEKRDAILAMQIEHTQTQIKQTMDIFNKQIQDWTSETKKELGADTDKALAVASKGIDQVFPNPAENKAFRDMMKETGLGNWNLMVRFASFIGKSVSEDKLVAGKPASEGRKSNAEVIFDHPTSKV